MRAIPGWVLVPALIFAFCAQLGATTVNSSVSTDGVHTTYSYTLASDEQDDFVIAFHVYAPVDPLLVTGWCASPDWSFAKVFDDEITAADLYWCVSNPEVRWLAFGDSLEFTIQTDASVPSAANYVIPDYLGNWGIETEGWAGWGVFVMLPSVPVPNQLTAGVPEPCSAAAIVVGLGAFGLTRGSKRRTR